jgi:hypothetical protein
MPKYIFSGGRVWVEEGVYSPLLNRHKREAKPTVLIVVQRPRHSHQLKSSTLKQEARTDDP